MSCAHAVGPPACAAWLTLWVGSSRDKYNSSVMQNDSPALSTYLSRFNFIPKCNFLFPDINAIILRRLDKNEYITLYTGTTKGNEQVKRLWNKLIYNSSSHIYRLILWHAISSIFSRSSNEIVIWDSIKIRFYVDMEKAQLKKNHKFKCNWRVMSCYQWLSTASSHVSGTHSG